MTKEKPFSQDPEGIVTGRLVTPSVGQVLFHPEGQIVAEVTEVTEDGFHFEVHNGAWSGSWSSEGVHVVHTGETIKTGPFREVLSISEDAAAAWYTAPFGPGAGPGPEVHDPIEPSF